MTWVLTAAGVITGLFVLAAVALVAFGLIRWAWGKVQSQRSEAKPVAQAEVVALKLSELEAKIAETFAGLNALRKEAADKAAEAARAEAKIAEAFGKPETTP